MIPSIVFGAVANTGTSPVCILMDRLIWRGHESSLKLPWIVRTAGNCNACVGPEHVVNYHWYLRSVDIRFRIHKTRREFLLTCLSPFLSKYSFVDLDFLVKKRLIIRYLHPTNMSELYHLVRSSYPTYMIAASIAIVRHIEIARTWSEG